MTKNIVLLGLMGSGKTTIGKLISKKTSKMFIDTDEIIEKKSQMTINEIFEVYGEDFFRKLELETVKEISCNNDQVISTGGGIVKNPENIKNLKKNGILFYLQVPPEELFERIKNKKTRPLLKAENPVEILRKLLTEREKFYNLADYKISAYNKDLDSIVCEIIEKYEHFANKDCKSRNTCK